MTYNFFSTTHKSYTELLTKDDATFEREISMIDDSKLNDKVIYDCGETFLHLSVRKNNYYACKQLLERNARTDIKDIYGKTAFDYACEINNKDIIKLFVDNVKSTTTSESRKRLREWENSYYELSNKYNNVIIEKDSLSKRTKFVENNNVHLKMENATLRRSARIAEKNKKDLETELTKTKEERDDYKTRYETLRKTAFEKNK